MKWQHTKQLEAERAELIAELEQSVQAEDLDVIDRPSCNHPTPPTLQRLTTSHQCVTPPAQVPIDTAPRVGASDEQAAAQVRLVPSRSVASPARTHHLLTCAASVQVAVGSARGEPSGRDEAGGPRPEAAPLTVGHKRPAATLILIALPRSGERDRG
jgi:hypothetical protein